MTTMTASPTKARSTGTATGQRGRVKATAAGGVDATSRDGSADRSVTAGVQRDLEALAKSAPALATSGLALSALALAGEIDSPHNSATSKSMCARVLLDTLDHLRELAPEGQEADELDELSARRTARRQSAS